MTSVTIKAKGHENVIAEHPTTIEITKEDYLTDAGTCIIAINADTACLDLTDDMKEAIRTGKKFVVTLKVGDIIDKVHGQGHPDLKLENDHDIIFRKSSFNEDRRTLLINCDKSARDLKRELIEKLKDPNSELEITIEPVSKSK